MGLPAANLRMTPAEFLEWEYSQQDRHEFVDGEVFAMAGAADAHVTVALNVAMALRQHLAGTPCRTYITDMKLRVDASNAYFYPDVMVSCSAADAREAIYKREPVLVVEVLSPNTAAFDMGAKFAHYRKLASLREYWLIEPLTRRSDLFRRTDDGRTWTLHPLETNDLVHLASVALEIPPAALWAELIGD